MDRETEALLARDPQHQTPPLVLSHIVEVDIAAEVDGVAVTGTAVAGVLRSSMTDRIALGADPRKVDGVAEVLVSGMNAIATATSTPTYDPGMPREMTVTFFSEICRVILVTSGIPATLLTATYAQKPTGKVLWPPSP